MKILDQLDETKGKQTPLQQMHAEGYTDYGSETIADVPLDSDFDLMAETAATQFNLPTYAETQMDTTNFDELALQVKTQSLNTQVSASDLRLGVTETAKRKAAEQAANDVDETLQNEFDKSFLEALRARGEQNNFYYANNYGKHSALMSINVLGVKGESISEEDADNLTSTLIDKITILGIDLSQPQYKSALGTLGEVRTAEGISIWTAQLLTSEENKKIIAANNAKNGAIAGILLDIATTLPDPTLLIPGANLGSAAIKVGKIGTIVGKALKVATIGAEGAAYGALDHTISGDFSAAKEMGIGDTMLYGGVLGVGLGSSVMVYKAARKGVKTEATSVLDKMPAEVMDDVKAPKTQKEIGTAAKDHLPDDYAQHLKESKVGEDLHEVTFAKTLKQQEVKSQKLIDSAEKRYTKITKQKEAHTKKLTKLRQKLKKAITRLSKNKNKDFHKGYAEVVDDIKFDILHHKTERNKIKTEMTTIKKDISGYKGTIAMAVAKNKNRHFVGWSLKELSDEAKMLSSHALETVKNSMRHQGFSSSKSFPDGLVQLHITYSKAAALLEVNPSMATKLSKEYHEAVETVMSKATTNEQKYNSFVLEKQAIQLRMMGDKISESEQVRLMNRLDGIERVLQGLDETPGSSSFLSEVEKANVDAARQHAVEVDEKAEMLQQTRRDKFISKLGDLTKTYLVSDYNKVMASNDNAAKLFVAKLVRAPYDVYKKGTETYGLVVDEMKKIIMGNHDILDRELEDFWRAGLKDGSIPSGTNLVDYKNAMYTDLDKLAYRQRKEVAKQIEVQAGLLKNKFADEKAELRAVARETLVTDHNAPSSKVDELLDLEERLADDMEAQEIELDVIRAEIENVGTTKGGNKEALQTALKDTEARFKHKNSVLVKEINTVRGEFKIKTLSEGAQTEYMKIITNTYRKSYTDELNKLTSEAMDNYDLSHLSEPQMAVMERNRSFTAYGQEAGEEVLKGRSKNEIYVPHVWDLEAINSLTLPEVTKIMKKAISDDFTDADAVRVAEFMYEKAKKKQLGFTGLPSINSTAGHLKSRNIDIDYTKVPELMNTDYNSNMGLHARKSAGTYSFKIATGKSKAQLITEFSEANPDSELLTTLVSLADDIGETLSNRQMSNEFSMKIARNLSAWFRTEKMGYSGLKQISENLTTVSSNHGLVKGLPNVTKNMVKSLLGRHDTDSIVDILLTENGIGLELRKDQGMQLASQGDIGMHAYNKKDVSGLIQRSETVYHKANGLRQMSHAMYKAETELTIQSLTDKSWGKLTNGERQRVQRIGISPESYTELHNALKKEGLTINSKSSDLDKLSSKNRALLSQYISGASRNNVLQTTSVHNATVFKDAGAVEQLLFTLKSFSGQSFNTWGVGLLKGDMSRGKMAIYNFGYVMAADYLIGELKYQAGFTDKNSADLSKLDDEGYWQAIKKVVDYNAVTGTAFTIAETLSNLVILTTGLHDGDSLVDNKSALSAIFGDNIALTSFYTDLERYENAMRGHDTKKKLDAANRLLPWGNTIPYLAAYNWIYDSQHKN